MCRSHDRPCSADSDSVTILANFGTFQLPMMNVYAILWLAKLWGSP